MSMYQPKTGDRVRVVLEGEVIYAMTDPSGYCTLKGSGDTDVSYNGAEVVSIEKLADPEPEWKPGDVIQIKDGPSSFAAIMAYGDSPKWMSMSVTWEPAWITERWNKGQVTLIFRDGKVVA